VETAVQLHQLANVRLTLAAPPVRGRVPRAHPQSRGRQPPPQRLRHDHQPVFLPRKCSAASVGPNGAWAASPAYFCRYRASTRARTPARFNSCAPMDVLPTPSTPSPDVGAGDISNEVGRGHDQSGATAVRSRVLYRANRARIAQEWMPIGGRPVSRESVLPETVSRPSEALHKSLLMAVDGLSRNCPGRLFEIDYRRTSLMTTTSRAVTARTIASSLPSGDHAWAAMRSPPV